MAKSPMQQDVHEQLKKLPRTEPDQLAIFAVKQSTHTVMEMGGGGARGRGTRPSQNQQKI
jgi:hypothetical protein